ncbi:prepilin-type N-terminal cleavage/methylation domain-containing protein [Elusimicrobium posterum]|uniref:type IV pilin protein n=1 Tax=Elusimicrobium posterum TaxID=3116653 RepID=UPI003C76E505
MGNNKKGFTLIELLVVVLIIGILAAIALPQYQKAVRRARAAEAVIIAKSMVDAIKIYQMETGTTPTMLEDLAITLPGKYSGVSSVYDIQNISNTYTLYLSTTSGGFTIYDRKPNVRPFLSYGPATDILYCLGVGRNTEDEAVCKSVAQDTTTQYQCGFYPNVCLLVKKY